MDEDEEGIIPLNLEFTNNLRDRIVKKIAEHFTDEKIDSKLKEIEIILGNPMEKWLARDFFEYHINLYLRRPVYWQLSSFRFGKNKAPPGIFSCFLHYLKITPDTIAKIQVNYVSKVKDSLFHEKGRIQALLEEERIKPKSLKLKSYVKQYQNIEGQLTEITEFEHRLQELVSPREKKTKLSKKSLWLLEKIAEVRDNGWVPNLDYGVKVNIEPLKELKLLPKIADKVK